MENINPLYFFPLNFFPLNFLPSIFFPPSKQSLKEANQYADFLAKHGANQWEPIRNWHTPPSDMADLLATNATCVTYLRS